MATLLYRLGRFSYRHAWRVIGVWVLVLIAVLGAGIGLGGKTQESFAIPGTESQQALDRLEAVFPSVAGASATAVVVAPAGASIGSEKATIEELVTAIEKVPGIDSAMSPFDQYAGKAISDDGTMAIIRVQFDGPSTDVTDATIADLKATPKSAPLRASKSSSAVRSSRRPASPSPSPRSSVSSSPVWCS